MAEYTPKHVTLPAFDVVGLTQFVHSGGELFNAVWRDGRWAKLRALGGDDPTIYGVASHDEEVPEGHYRYSMAVGAPAGQPAEVGLDAPLFSMHIGASEWLIFTLNFGSGSFGKLWEDDPYRIISGLGWEFNGALGLHLDVYRPSYVTLDDDFEFWMPVKRPG